LVSSCERPPSVLGRHSEPTDSRLSCPGEPLLPFRAVRRPRPSCLMLAGAVLLGACADGDRPEAQGEDGGLPTATRVVSPLDVGALLEGNRAFDCDAPSLGTQVDDVVGRMTLEQKVAEMHG